MKARRLVAATCVPGDRKQVNKISLAKDDLHSRDVHVNLECS